MRQAMAPQPDQQGSGLPGLKPMNWMRRWNPVAQNKVNQGSQGPGFGTTPLNPMNQPMGQRNFGRPGQNQQRPQQQQAPAQQQQAPERGLADYRLARRQAITDSLFSNKNFPMTPAFREGLSRLDLAAEKRLAQLGLAEDRVEAALEQAKAEILDSYASNQSQLVTQGNVAGLMDSGLMDQQVGELNDAAFADKTAAWQQHAQSMSGLAQEAADIHSGWREGVIDLVGQRAFDTASNPDMDPTHGRRRRR